MNKTTALVAIAAIMITVQLSAQPMGRQLQMPEGSVAPVTNINKNAYPRLMPDQSVMFRVNAPTATKVQVDLGQVYDMTRDNNGVWTVQTKPQVPGFHYYSLIIDGVSVADPASESFYGCSRMSSAIEVPEKGTEYMEVQNVPHGEVRTMWYFSKKTSSWRPLNVYTPPTYNQNSTKKYPVVYIQHGGGEDHRGWVQQGRTDIILDNLIAEGKAVEMIVVSSNSNIGGASGGGGYNWQGMQPFKEELLDNIIPFVDKTFRTIADRKHRAMCGLSMGGGQSFYIGLRDLDVFSSVGVFSSGMFGGIAGSANFDADKEIPGLLSNSKSYNDKLDVFFISCGEQDPRIEYTKKMAETMQKNGLEVKFSSYPGDHEWQVWRKSLHEFAPMLFKK